MNYEEYQMWGMNFLWWFFAISLVVWIFGSPYKIPGQRSHKETPLERLKIQFAEGKIKRDEFEKLKISMNKNN